MTTRTDADTVTAMFETGDVDETRLDTVVGIAIDIAHDFVEDRMTETYDDADRLERFETLVACHVLHAPYPHEDKTRVGDGEITFAGSGLGNNDGMLDPDGLAETRYGRMLMTADTKDALVTDEQTSTFETFGATSGSRSRRTDPHRY